MKSPTLPIDSHLASIRASLGEQGCAVVQAEPGAGKTTRLPPALLEATDKAVVVLEPRRLAAKLAATRIAEELGVRLGDLVGYRVRHEGQSSASTRLLFVTEGLFFRMLLDDPSLARVGVVVLDEFHERQIHCDLALAAVRQLQSTTRPDLKVVVMSATLETTSLGEYLPSARIFRIPGRTFPIVHEYLAPTPGEELLSLVRRAAVQMASDSRCPGDILIFLTGLAEIMRAADRVATALPDWDVLPLTAELSPAQQAQVFRPGTRRKVVLATNVAETSVTIPGITGVIDSGLAKQAGQAVWNGLPTLDVRKVSQASCVQRAGRAGRVAPGVAYRLFEERDFHARPAFTAPEIKRLDLTQTLLEVHLLAEKLGLPPAPAERLLPWLETPDGAIVQSAEQTLLRLGAVEPTAAERVFTLTDLGRRMVSWPLHPRLAAMIVAGERLGVKRIATLAACLISEGFLLSKGFQAAEVAECDLRYQMGLLVRAVRRQEIKPRVVADAVDPGQVRKVKQLYESLTRDNLAAAAAEVVDLSAAGERAFAAAVLAGFPDRLAKRRTLKKEHEGPRAKALFNFCLGRGGQLAAGSVCRDEDLIVAIDASEAVTSQNAAQGITIWTASGVRTEDVLALGNDLLRNEHVCVWNDAAERVDAVRRTVYGQISLKEERGSAAPELVEEILRGALLDRWPKPFDDDSDLRSYHARVDLVSEAEPERSLPRFEDTMLELLAAAISEGKRSFKEVASRPLRDYIDEQLSYDDRRLLDDLTPRSIKLRNGREMNVIYEPGRPPYISGYIQDFYGVSESPRILKGRIPLSTHLLGPNRRPLQVTSDLAGFWRQTYPQLKGELSRNYPRHHWPDDPLKAPPILVKSRLPK